MSREVHRVLKPGGRAIFQEPVRNSRILRFVRALIPYRAPDISPFERPLTDHELTAFGRRFASRKSRPFLLPHVQLGQVLPVVRDYWQRLYALDGAILRAVPALKHIAGIRVIELTK